MEIIILHPARERHPLSYSTPFLVTPSKTWLFKKPSLENVLSFDYGQQASFSDCPVSILSTSKFDLVFCDRVRSPIMIRFSENRKYHDKNRKFIPRNAIERFRFVLYQSIVFIPRGAPFSLGSIDENTL